MKKARKVHHSSEAIRKRPNLEKLKKEAFSLRSMEKKEKSRLPAFTERSAQRREGKEGFM